MAKFVFILLGANKTSPSPASFHPYLSVYVEDNLWEAQMTSHRIGWSRAAGSVLSGDVIATRRYFPIAEVVGGPIHARQPTDRPETIKTNQKLANKDDNSILVYL